MASVLNKSVELGVGAALLITLSGCTGTLKMPINEYSHVSVEATPFKSKFAIAYHLYEALPYHTQDPWQAKMQLDGLGTIYDSNQAISPAAKRLEDAWERLWVDGRPDWSAIVRMMREKDSPLNPYSAEPAVVADAEIESLHSPTYLPVAAGLSGFMLSSKPDL
jgi:hypothetical protein